MREDGRDLSLRQVAMLCMIYLSETPIYATDLRSQLRLTGPTVTRDTDRIVDGGFMLRVPSLRDRRKTILCPTDAGLAFVRRLGAMDAAPLSSPSQFGASHDHV